MPELINIYIFDQWWMNKILINNEKQSMKVYKFKYKKDVLHKKKQFFRQWICFLHSSNCRRNMDDNKFITQLKDVINLNYLNS